jgi:hypothetical protein
VLGYLEYHWFFKVSAPFYNINEGLTKKNLEGTGLVSAPRGGKKSTTAIFIQSLAHISIRFPIHHSLILGSMFRPFLPHINPPFHIGTQVEW